MKILALMSSYRKKGNTARIVQMIEAQMAETAARHDEALDFETLYLAHKDIEVCRGCRTCFDRGEEKCPLKDDLPAIRAKIDAADGIILASPVYVDDVNAVAKNWIDRMAYVCHRPAFGGKCATLIATVGEGPTRHTLRTMNFALRSWGFHIVGRAGYKMGALMSQAEAERHFQDKASDIAARLFQAVAQQQYLRPSFISLMIFRVQQHAWRKVSAPDSYDYAYWKNRGWFEPDCTFYIEHRANPAKVTLARLVGAALAPFVT